MEDNTGFNHVINRNIDGTEYAFTCDDKIFGIIKASEILNWRDPERFFEDVLRKHIQEVHAGDSPIHGGDEDTAEDTERALREKLEKVRAQLLSIYNEPAPTGTDLFDFAHKIRNLAMDGITMIRKVDFPPFKN